MVLRPFVKQVKPFVDSFDPCFEVLIKSKYCWRVFLLEFVHYSYFEALIKVSVQKNNNARKPSNHQLEILSKASLQSIIISENSEWNSISKWKKPKIAQSNLNTMTIPLSSFSWILAWEWRLRRPKQQLSLSLLITNQLRLQSSTNQGSLPSKPYLSQNKGHVIAV